MYAVNRIGRKAKTAVAPDIVSADYYPLGSRAGPIQGKDGNGKTVGGLAATSESSLKGGRA